MKTELIAIRLSKQELEMLKELTKHKFNDNNSQTLRQLIKEAYKNIK